MVRCVTQDGPVTPRVAQTLGMSEALLGRWVRAARAQTTRPAGSDELEQENKQVRAQLARAEMERDSLKKALTIFSQAMCSRNASCWALVPAATTPGMIALPFVER